MTSSPVVLITGSSSGIGRAAAIECASRGARIAVHYHQNRGEANATLAALPGEGHSVFQCDVTDPADVQNLGDDVIRQMGGIDVLVNNAGISRRIPFDSLDYNQWQASWHRVLNTNLLGPANLSFCIAKTMASGGGGRIVNVSSRGAFRGEPQMPWYGASKAGLNAMGQSLAVALAPHNIFVYTVAPGFVETPMAAGILDSSEGDEIRAQSPFGRVAQPEEVGKTIAFLALDAPEFLTGCIIDVNGASYLRS
ncbi:MAG: SDR family oxidoreductase [Arenicellales bacterium]|nr:SDR family oxidoreductase [Arenicellales bacterium]